MHFDEALSARYKGGDSTKLVTKGIRGKSAFEKLSEEGLVKFSARVSKQVIFINLRGKALLPLSAERKCNNASSSAGIALLDCELLPGFFGNRSFLFLFFYWGGK